MLDKIWAYQKKLKEERYEQYKLIFEHYRNMEYRYHTWMNYYSLFNGALLVAYCGILVSAGKIVEVESHVSDTATALGSKIFYLDCTYWNILTLISVLGVTASYCWYLSIIGHRSWLEWWRKKLEAAGDYPVAISMRDSIKTKYRAHFHSTYMVTKFFIWCILFAWICVAIYSYKKHEITNELLLFSVVLTGFLIFLEYFLHVFIGSDLDPDASKKEFLKSLLTKRKFKVVIVFIIIYIISVSYWLCSLSNDNIAIYKLNLKYKSSDKTIITTLNDTII